MLAYLIYSKNDLKKNEWYIESYQEEATKRGIDLQLLIAEELTYGIKNQQWFLSSNGVLLPKPAFAIVRTIDPMLSRQLEYQGIRVFNNAKVAEICNNKAKTYQYVAKLNIPMIETCFYQNYQFFDAMAKNPYEQAVVKAVAGHGGSQVFLIDNLIEKNQELEEHNADKNESERKHYLETVFEKLEGQDFVLQPLTGHRHQDLRVYVLGDKIIGAVLRTAKEGFRSNFSLGGTVECYELSETELEIVNKIIGLFDFGLVGLDFIIGDDKELIFNEIEDVVGARMLYQCHPEINLTGIYLDYILSHLM